MAVPEWGPEVEGFKWLRPRANGVYYIRRKIEGSWRSISLNTGDLEQAKKGYIRQIGKPLPPASDNIRCGKAFKAFILRAKLAESTRKKYEADWRNYASDFLASKRAADVQPRDIIQVLEAARYSVRTGEALSEDTRHAIYVMLSAFFSSCTKEPTRYRIDNPVAAIGDAYRPDTSESGVIPDEVVLSDEEIASIAAVAGIANNPAIRAEYVGAIQRQFICEFMPLVGARLGEILGLKLTDWKRLNGGELHIERQVDRYAKASDEEAWFIPLKGKKGTVGAVVRVVPLRPEAIDLLTAYVDRGSREGWLKPGGLLLPSVEQTPRSVAHVSDQIRKAAEKALGRRVVSHWFRHTFASNLLANGASLEQIAELLGNSVEVCRKRYAHRVNRAAHNRRIVALMQGTG